MVRRRGRDGKDQCGGGGGAGKSQAEPLGELVRFRSLKLRWCEGSTPAASLGYSKAPTTCRRCSVRMARSVLRRQPARRSA